MQEKESGRGSHGNARLHGEGGRHGNEATGPRAKSSLRLTAAQCELIVQLMLERDGLAGACRKARIPLALVLNERRRNAAFRRALAAAEKERHALLRMLLTDLAVRGLLPDGEAPHDGAPHDGAREKFLSSLAQALVEQSIRARGDAAAPRAASAAKGGGKAARTAALPPLAPDALERLLAETERRIAAAEAELDPPAAPAARDGKTAARDGKTAPAREGA